MEHFEFVGLTLRLAPVHAQQGSMPRWHRLGLATKPLLGTTMYGVIFVKACDLANPACGWKLIGTQHPTLGGRP